MTEVVFDKILQYVSPLPLFHLCKEVIMHSSQIRRKEQYPPPRISIYINHLEFFCKRLVPICLFLHLFLFFHLLQQFHEYLFYAGVVTQYKTIYFVAQVVPAFSHWELFQLAVSLWHTPIMWGLFVYEHFYTFWHCRIL